MEFEFVTSVSCVDTPCDASFVCGKFVYSVWGSS